MASTIKLKNGSGAPLAGDLVQGEPALDLTNKRLYTEDSGGNVIEVGINPSSLTIGGTALTATAAELNTLDGITATTAELNTLDGITATVTELNYTDGVTSNIQTQLNTKAPIASPTFTGTVTADGLTVENAGSAAKAVIKSTTTAGGQTQYLNSSTGTTGFLVGLLGDTSGNGTLYHQDAKDILFYTNGLKRANFGSGGDISFYEDTGTTAKFFWDASAESAIVGGTTAVNLGDTTGNGVQLSENGINLKRTCTSSTQSLLNLNNIGTDGNVVEFYIDGTQTGALGVASGAALTFAAGAGSAEAARIDSSGNLLVGKSATSFGTQGVELQDDRIWATTSQAATGYFNRLIDDGDIVKFYKDGTTVGSIGTRAGYSLIGSGDTGVLFNSGNDRIQPESTTGGARDAAIDIGGSTTRFKDLYLSGGVYLGGSGAANKLDDYEEGTWTVTLTDASSNASPTTVTGYYTKVGNKVTASFYTMLNIDTTGMTPSDALFISLPFTSGSTGAAVGAITHNGIDIGSRTQSNLRIANATDKALIQTTGSTLGSDTVSVSDISSGVDDITFATITYFTA